MLETLIIITICSIIFASISLAAFSDFIMRGLSRKSSLAAVQAMQGINETVLKSLFIVCFMANNILLLLVAILVGTTMSANIMLPVAALVVYFFGMFMVTGGINVPLNNKLAKANPHSESDAKQIWQEYARPWVLWNTVRTFAGLVSAGLLGYFQFAIV